MSKAQVSEANDMIYLKILKQVDVFLKIFNTYKFLFVKITNEYAPLILFKASISY